jgi:hypothetical protein
MTYGHGMSNEPLPTGPDPEAITRIILDRHPDALTVSAMGATFFSLDESHWPNFATIVTTDEHDEAAPSRLTDRPGAFRLNLGVSRSTAERVAREAGETPDHAAFGELLPHPVYAKQHWISILNPTHEQFRDVVVPLVDEAHDRLAASRTRHATRGDAG